MKSDTDVRLSRECVMGFVARLAPEYLEVFHECGDPSTWLKISEQWAGLRKRLKIENYVLLYDDERRIQAALMNALMSPEEQQAWAKELNDLSPEEQRDALNEFARPGGALDEMASAIFPEGEQAELEQKEAFETLGEEEKQAVLKRGQYLYMGVFAWLYQALAVMVHGEKMTSLVFKALAGDKDAFAKAIHIDKTLILEHPGFKAIHAKAIIDGDKALLEKIARRLSAPITKGRIRHAGVFTVFALLESMRWLDDILHREILDICDQAGIDRWQNRIEDENAVTKALIKYRRYQKTGGVSMH